MGAAGRGLMSFPLNVRKAGSVPTPMYSFHRTKKAGEWNMWFWSKLERCAARSLNVCPVTADCSPILCPCCYRAISDRFVVPLRPHLQVNTNRIVEEATHQHYSAPAVRKAMGIMVIKNQLKEYNHGRLIERLR